MDEFSFYNHFYSPATEWPKLRHNFYRLNSKYDFDLETARREYERIVREFPLQPFEFKSPTGVTRKRTSYQGLGLTSKISTKSTYDSLSLFSEKGPLDIYQTFKKVSDKKTPEDREIEPLYENDFSIQTDACSVFYQGILQKFNSPYSKVRFLELKPGGQIPMHFDFPYYQAIRIHACLFTNDEVWWKVENEEFQIPADGRFYWFDTGKYHSVINKGRTNRIVISINLLVYRDRQNNPVFGSNQDLFELMEQGRL